MTTLSSSTAVRALGRFHLRTATRVALRDLAPSMALIFGGVVFLGPDFTKNLSLILFPDQPNLARSLALLALGAGMTAVVRRRTRADRVGWLRTLPTTPQARRIAAAAGAVVVQLPLCLWLLGLLGVGYSVGRLSPEAVSVELVGLALLVIHLAFLSIDAEALITARLLHLLGAIAATSATGLGLLAALALAISGARLSDRLPRTTLARDSIKPLSAHLPPALFPWALEIALLVRLPKLREYTSAAIAAGLPLALSLAFTRNNSLPTPFVDASWRLGVGAALTLAMTAIAEAAKSRFVPWSWQASLPLGAGTHLLQRTAGFALVSAPIWLTATLFKPSLGLVLLAPGLLVAIRSAASLIQEDRPFSGAPIQVLGEGLLWAGAVAIDPRLAFLAALLLPFAFVAAKNKGRGVRATPSRPETEKSPRAQDVGEGS